MRRLVAGWVFVALCVVGVTGCSHKKPAPDENSALGIVTTADLGSSDQGKAYGIKTVNFSYDGYILDVAAKAILSENAKILKSHASAKIQIEGYCDNRGGIQYNIALGEKRAKAALHYLRDLGISEGRLTTVSYGKENPLDTAETEEAYAKNRRANFVLTAK